MFERRYDAKIINEIINSPNIFKKVAVYGQDKIDLTPLVKDDNNVLIADESGGIFFHHLGAGRYEAHPQFRKGTPGKSILEKSKIALKYVFENMPCFDVIANSPKSYRHSAFLALSLGFVHNQTLKDASIGFDGKKQDIEQYILNKVRWIERKSK